jgi:excisionase family DNA binding protein
MTLTLPSRPSGPNERHPIAVVEQEYYNIADVAALLGVSRVSVWRWIKSGRLPAARLGHRTVRITRKDLEQVARATRASVELRVMDASLARPHRSARAAEHVVLFYEAEAFLFDSVAEFVTPALRAGDRAVLIATPGHRAGIEMRLSEAGLDLARMQADGQFVARDARATLWRFTEGDRLHPERFAEVVRELVDGSSPTRVFGEMVALLVADGFPEVALELESLWARAQRGQPFSLWCAYPLRQCHGEAMASFVADACLAHQAVVPTESYSELAHPDRLRNVAALQQKAQWLEREISERQRLAEQLERALEAERTARSAAEKALRARDEFLSTASHELRTPITVLGVQAQMLLRRMHSSGPLEPARLEKALRTIGTQADKLGQLVGQLLDVSRVDSGKLVIEPRSIDLVGLVNEVVATSRSLSGKHEIREHAPAAVHCQVDPLRIEQVLLNLIDNALKYSPDGTPIDVELSLAGDGCAELSVRDYGGGIEPEKRGQIFERFFQAQLDGGRTGLGLGLYLCRVIVELHGGTISAEFPSDGGTRLVVRLPL